MAGYLWGKIKGESSSTDATLAIGSEQTLDLEKNAGNDYWQYSTAVSAGNYDCTAKDVTSGSGGNEETKNASVYDNQWTELNFDIS